MLSMPVPLVAVFTCVYVPTLVFHQQIPLVALRSRPPTLPLLAELTAFELCLSAPLLLPGPTHTHKVYKELVACCNDKHVTR